jgi:3-isopropylmalate/(R)-2-methylmalate dehydratase large subunit
MLLKEKKPIKKIRIWFQQGSHDRKTNYVFLGVVPMVVLKILELLHHCKGKTKAANVTAWLVPGSHVVEAQIKKKEFLIY